MKVGQYLDIREEAAKLALYIQFGSDNDTIAKINQAFEEAEEASGELLAAAFGSEEVEAVLDIMDMPVADIPVARI
ncbi:hypothetical protein L6Q21_08640 [Sandaracinobacter sp. RS1-74]|uniref:hypothetical protein n=1 Tax=Sandaracinobacteroides sayramensis TaxID=2913411 RepID=UPI001EDA6E9B|nr:hypothetical protein [Sandaracinobacteroides sayramensis]MCG2841048.1 hypothetical protein [Sandaracinobacteroides sayramensis]